MKKSMLVFVILIVILCGIFYKINYKHNNFESSEVGIGKKFMQSKLGQAVRGNNKVFVIEKIEKVNNNKYSIILSEGNYREFYSVFYLYGGRDYTLQMNPFWNFKEEKNEKGETVGIYISLDYKNDEYISNRTKGISIDDLQQIFLCPVYGHNIRTHYTVNLK